MNFTEILITVLPTVIFIGIGFLLIRRTGAFGQVAHRRRVEELLERIAIAVERGDK